jgi:uncharacterized protein YndB with AHSA1/START domain
MSNETTKRIAGISDEAVRVKTGKDWMEWFTILDAAGAMVMEHKDIALYLSEQQGVPDWWCQMVTNRYEQERKGRGKHQMPDGYQISKSKTVSVPLARLYAAWKDEVQLETWIDEPGLQIRKATPEKSMRLTWVDQKTTIEVNFYSKGEGRSQVTVQHNKLPDTTEAERMMEYWAKALQRLQDMLEV